MSILSDARRFRRVTAAVGLTGFSLLLLPQGVVDPSAGGTPEIFYEAATRHSGRLLAAAVLLIGSAVLTMPAVYGVVHQARDRGVVLAHLGGVFGVLGAMGHMGIATLYLIMLSLAGGDRAEMLALVNRLNESTAVGVVVFPLILSFGIGITLLAWAAWRAGLIGWWAPGLITAVVLAHAAIPQVPAAVEDAALLGIAAVFGWLGIRTLRMRDVEWDSVATQPATAADAVSS